MSDDPTREAWEQLIRAMRNRLSHTEERDSRQRYRHALNEQVRAFEIVMRYQPDSKRPLSFLLSTRAVPPNAACFLRDLLLAKPDRQTISGDMRDGADDRNPEPGLPRSIGQRAGSARRMDFPADRRLSPCGLTTWNSKGEGARDVEGSDEAPPGVGIPEEVAGTLLAGYL